jgi:hypothetical protein
MGSLGVMAACALKKPVRMSKTAPRGGSIFGGFLGGPKTGFWTF